MLVDHVFLEGTNRIWIRHTLSGVYISLLLLFAWWLMADGWSWDLYPSRFSFTHRI